MLMRRAGLAGLAGLAMLACGNVPVEAQNFTKQVHIIVPYGPGGTSDILARLIGPKLSEAIGQPVIVENKPSASGNIGADFVAKQAGDGHTLLITDVGTLATQPSLVKRLVFDVQKDLVPVGMVMFSPYLFAVHPSAAGEHVAELVAYDKANPGKLNVGNSGVGSIQHLARDRDRQEVRAEMGHGAVSRRRAGDPRRGVEREQRDLQRRARDHAVRHAEPAQGHRGVGRQAPARRAEPADLQGARHADRRGRLLAGLPRPAKARRRRWRRGSTPRSRRSSPCRTSPSKIIELGGDVRTSDTPAEFGGWIAKAIADWGAVVKAEGIQVDGYGCATLPGAGRSTHASGMRRPIPTLAALGSDEGAG